MWDAVLISMVASPSIRSIQPCWVSTVWMRLTGHQQPLAVEPARPGVDDVGADLPAVDAVPPHGRDRHHQQAESADDVGQPARRGPTASPARRPIRRRRPTPRRRGRARKRDPHQQVLDRPVRDRAGRHPMRGRTQPRWTGRPAALLVTAPHRRHTASLEPRRPPPVGPPHARRPDHRAQSGGRRRSVSGVCNVVGASRSPAELRPGRRKTGCTPTGHRIFCGPSRRGRRASGDRISRRSHDSRHPGRRPGEAVR